MFSATTGDFHQETLGEYDVSRCMFRGAVVRLSCTNEKQSLQVAVPAIWRVHVGVFCFAPELSRYATKKSQHTGFSSESAQDLACILARVSIEVVRSVVFAHRGSP